MRSKLRSMCTCASIMLLSLTSHAKADEFLDTIGTPIDLGAIAFGQGPAHQGMTYASGSFFTSTGTCVAPIKVMTIFRYDDQWNLQDQIAIDPFVDSGYCHIGDIAATSSHVLAPISNFRSR